MNMWMDMFFTCGGWGRECLQKDWDSLPCKIHVNNMVNNYIAGRLAWNSLATCVAIHLLSLTLHKVYFIDLTCYLVCASSTYCQSTQRDANTGGVPPWLANCCGDSPLPPWRPHLWPVLPLPRRTERHPCCRSRIQPQPSSHPTKEPCGGQRWWPA